MVDRWATVQGDGVVLRGGVNDRPRASMVHEAASLSSNSMRRIRRILPSFTSTNTGPPVVPLVYLFTSPIPTFPLGIPMRSIQP